MTEEQIAETFLRLQTEPGDSTPKYKPIDPKRIPTGLNNAVPKKVAFNVSLVDNFQTRV